MGKGRLARLLVMSLTVSVAITTTRIMKYKIYHTPAHYFKIMSSHMGYGLEYMSKCFSYIDKIFQWHH